MRIISSLVHKQKKFDYNYYLTKSCPHPADWKERKPILESEAKKFGPARGAVYKELFEYSSSNRQVADFLTEFVAQCLPKDFMIGKNKKIFNKKVF